MKSITTHSVAETKNFAKRYIEGILKSRTKSSEALIIGLYGNLGSGKTAFTQGMAEALGILDHVTSPTFVIQKIYPLMHSLSNGKSQDFAQDFSTFTHLIHIDAYRLESADEMEHLGWHQIANNQRNIIIIEWPEKIEALLPANHIRLKFTFIDENTRQIEIEAKMVQ
jgi:tRNA threonylcarbamoyladenosine biosynthesis protein TsaE